MKDQDWKGRLLFFFVVAVFLGGILSVYGGAPPATPLNGQSGTAYSTDDIIARDDLWVVDDLSLGAAGDFEINWTGANTASLGAGDTLTGDFSGTFTGSVNVTIASPYDYIGYRIGATYYATSTTGAADYSNANFVTLMNTLIPTLSPGDVIHLKTGTYVVGATITGATGISIEGEGYGTVLDASSMADGDTAISYLGTVGAYDDFTANIDLGDTSITVAAGDEAHFAVNDLIYIHTDTALGQSREGELQYVGSTAVGTIYLRQGAAYDTYLAAAVNPHVGVVTPVKDFHLSGFKLLGDWDEADILNGITIQYGQNIQIDKVWISGCSRYGLYICNIEGIQVTNCNIEGASKDGLGYGICSDYAIQNLIVASCTFNNNRHSFTAGGGAGLWGVTRNAVISKCVSRDSMAGQNGSGSEGAHYDLHTLGEDITFIGCSAIGGYQGFSVPGMGVMLIGCQVFDTTNIGITIGNVAGIVDIKIQGCLVKNAGASGMYFTGASTDDLEIRDCTVIDSYVQGIWISGPDGVVIEGCTVKGSGRDGTNSRSDIYLDGDTNYSLIQGNKLGPSPSAKYHIDVHAATVDDSEIWSNYYVSDTVTADTSDAGTSTNWVANVAR